MANLLCQLLTCKVHICFEKRKKKEAIYQLIYQLQSLNVWFCLHNLNSNWKDTKSLKNSCGGL